MVRSADSRENAAVRDVGLKSNSFLKYVNEGVYPFYIIHQTVTVAIVYYVVPHAINICLIFGLVIVGTATITRFGTQHDVAALQCDAVTRYKQLN